MAIDNVEISWSYLLENFQENNLYPFFGIGMIKFLQTSLTAKLSEVESICVKLIDRWNRSDEVRDRRHEQLLEQINRITDDLNYLKGKSNGK